jgi:hypothetical protein
MDSDVEILQNQPKIGQCFHIFPKLFNTRKKGTTNNFITVNLIFTEAHFGALLEFLEICIHHLIFMHKVYPAGIFSRKQRYGVIVQVSLWTPVYLMVISFFY